MANGQTTTTPAATDSNYEKTKVRELKDDQLFVCFDIYVFTCTEISYALIHMGTNACTKAPLLYLCLTDF